MRVERASQDLGQWVIRAVCATATVRNETLEALVHLWPRETRTAVVYLQRRVG